MAYVVLAKSISGLDSAYAADATEPASLPAAGFDVPSPRPGPPRDMNTCGLALFFVGFKAYIILSFARWVEDGPLRTLGYLMRSTVSETQSWYFEQLYEGGINAKLVRVFGWCLEKDGLSASSQADETSLLVFAQPPWILAPADVTSFCECTDLPGDLSAKRRGKYILWAQVRDTRYDSSCLCLMCSPSRSTTRASRARRITLFSPTTRTGCLALSVLVRGTYIDLSGVLYSKRVQAIRGPTCARHQDSTPRIQPSSSFCTTGLHRACACRVLYNCLRWVSANLLWTVTNGLAGSSTSYHSIQSRYNAC